VDRRGTGTVPRQPREGSRAAVSGYSPVRNHGTITRCPARRRATLPWSPPGSWTCRGRRSCTWPATRARSRRPGDRRAVHRAVHGRAVIAALHERRHKTWSLARVRDHLGDPAPTAPVWIRFTWTGRAFSRSAQRRTVYFW